MSGCRGSGSLVTITGKLLGEPSLGNLFHGGWLREGLGDHRWRPLRNLRQGELGPRGWGSSRAPLLGTSGPSSQGSLARRHWRTSEAPSRESHWGSIADRAVGPRRWGASGGSSLGKLWDPVADWARAPRSPGRFRVPVTGEPQGLWAPSLENRALRRHYWRTLDVLW